MKTLETKDIVFELKDMDKQKRTAVIAHAVYDNIDRGKDVSRKGMFNKSWKENKGDISFYLNHNDEQAPGKVVDVFEDNDRAYTKAWLGTHTLGNDTLIMMDEGIIKKSSFGYITEKSNPLNIKGQMVRELKEVAHIETSVLTKMPMNPLAGVVSVTKMLAGLDLKSLSNNEQSSLKSILTNDMSALEQLVSLSSSLDSTSDLYTWINYNISRRAELVGEIRSQLKYNSTEVSKMKSYMNELELFCVRTKASDDCIKSILNEIENIKAILLKYNTANTQKDDDLIEPVASGNNDEEAFANSLYLMTTKY